MSCALPKKRTKWLVHAPPLEAFAIGTIAEPIALFRQTTRLAPLCNHSVAESARDGLRAGRLGCERDISPGRARLGDRVSPYGGFWRVRVALGAAALGRGRDRGLRVVPAARRLAAGRGRARVAGHRADRAEPAGLA